MKLGWDYHLDNIGHKLHLPKKLQGKICDWFDARLETPTYYTDGWNAGWEAGYVTAAKDFKAQLEHELEGHSDKVV